MSLNVSHNVNYHMCENCYHIANMFRTTWIKQNKIYHWYIWKKSKLLFGFPLNLHVKSLMGMLQVLWLISTASSFIRYLIGYLDTINSHHFLLTIWNRWKVPYGDNGFFSLGLWWWWSSRRADQWGKAGRELIDRGKWKILS